MTHRIPKSVATSIGDFETKVGAHAAEKSDWAAHMAKVGVDPEYVAYPSPQAHPDIEKAVREDGQNFIPDFEIVNDDPAPEIVLRMKKDTILNRIMGMERDAKAVVVPLGKRRHLLFMQNDIEAADAQRRGELLEAEGTQRLKETQRLAQQHAKELEGATTEKRAATLRAKHVEEMKAVAVAPDDIEERVAQGRPQEHADFIAEQAEREKRFAVIERHAARLMHDVEDLTEQNIDSWEPAPFPA